MVTVADDENTPDEASLSWMRNGTAEAVDAEAVRGNVNSSFPYVMLDSVKVEDATLTPESNRFWLTRGGLELASTSATRASEVWENRSPPTDTSNLSAQPQGLLGAGSEQR